MPAAAWAPATPLVWEIPGKAKPKERPRFVLERGKSPYTADATKSYERVVGEYTRKALVESRTPWPINIALTLCVVFYIVPAKNMSKSNRALAFDGVTTPHPDLDNLAKAVLDGMNGVLYIDDKQVNFLMLCKLFAREAKTVVSAAPTYKGQLCQGMVGNFVRETLPNRPVMMKWA